MANKTWPHGPAHWTYEPGTYMVTAGIYRKKHLLDTANRRDMLLRELFETAKEFGWNLQAWALMSNHYHIVARAKDASSLAAFMRKLHGNTARKLNLEDDASGRRVWHQFWDTHITYEKSWLARLRYVNKNPEHHGVAKDAEAYRWS